MTKNIYLGIAFACTCLHACKTPILVEKEIMIFDTGFPVNYYSYGSFYNKEDNKEYIYFGNVITENERVRFFDINGTPQIDMDVPLRKGMKGFREIWSIFVYNLDTIIIIDKDFYDNKMAYIDRKGECFLQIKFDTVFKTEKERYMMLYHTNHTVYKSFLYLSCFWNWRNPGANTESPPFFLSRLESWKEYYRQQHAAPHVCKFDIRTQTYTFGARHFIPMYFVQDTSLVLNEQIESCFDNKLFLWMHNSNKVLVLNPDNLQLECQFQITSNYTAIEHPPFSIAVKDSLSAASALFLKGRVCNVLYDRNHDLYYIVTRHEISVEEIDFYTEAPFSIHIYNTKFKKLGEQYFEGGKYDYQYMFLTSKGLLIAENENNRNYDPTKCKFVLFEIQKQ